MSDSRIIDTLLCKGVDYFNEKKFYNAHEVWEELWTDYALKDALFIQGLIQLSVAFFHITNLNLRGSRNLFVKCLPKLKKFPPNHRGFNLLEIIDCAERSKIQVESIKKSNEFNWESAPRIIIS
tara:strand:- start:12016 stop:12387 length:372 start_codon:yes stop_codon:yes gene_type:complete